MPLGLLLIDSMPATLKEFIINTLLELKEPDKVIKKPSAMMKRATQALQGRMRIRLPYGMVSADPFDKFYDLDEAC